MSFLGLLLFRFVFDSRLPSSKKNKGNCKRWADGPKSHGEYIASTMIQRFMDHDGGYLFDNVILSDGRDIDHIYVSRRGIFFISTLGAPGKYLGTDENEEWVRITPRNEKEIFASPSLYNQEFIDSFSSLVYPVHEQKNVVFFTNADFSNVMSKHAMSAMAFPNICLKLPAVLSDEEIYEIASAIVTHTH